MNSRRAPPFGTISAALCFITLCCSRALAQVAPAAPETIAMGDWQLAPFAEVRARGEYWHDLDGADRGVLVERARLGVDAIDGPVGARVVLQDARLWDAAAGTDTVGGPASLAATGVYEAWCEAHASGVRPSFVRIGRQPIAWGEGRLLGVADWSPTGRTLDSLRGRLVAGNQDFELMAASLSDPAANTLNAYGELFGARVQLALDPLFAVEAYALARLAQANPPQNLAGTVHGQTYTGALRLHGEAHGWNWGAEGAYQLGHVDQVSAGGARRAAWAAAGHLAYSIARVVLQPVVRLGVAYASGDHGGSAYRTFDPLLPDVHQWHGAMDLFAWSNEAEVSLRASATPATDVAAAIEYRYAQLADAGGLWTSGYLVSLGAASGNTERALGHEIDTELGWTRWVPVRLAVGYSMLVLGNGARAILEANRLTGPPPPLAHFAFAQVALRLP